MAVDADTAAVEVDEEEGLAPVASQDGPAVPDDDVGLAEDRKGPGVGLAVAVGVAAIAALCAMVGWFGYRGYQTHLAQQQRQLFLQAGRQGALNLTTIDYAQADADIQRILDSATGSFRDDFEKRSQPFIDVVKKAQSRSEGTITEAGLESQDGNEARVLVAVTVKTSLAGAAEPEPRAWRMRMTVQQVGDAVKVANVEFVP
ncbi:hypothetical protein ABW16_00375 [Mycolicibacter heraklionensis]|uniref:Mce protein n=1 Tax=Mycolicibacter heraklionensis TaxID=512402 RepID=A0ABR5FK12_9MYCO|nr:hypothetical protein [Mycolicibacter heraklionensis]KLO31370.1 hypothetical protein ABW16_00375 [Mycolicibacter heraklionensis]